MNDKLFPDLMALIDSGMLTQATVRIQARQMLALESMAETLTKIEALQYVEAANRLHDSEHGAEVKEMERPSGYWAENRSALDRIAETLSEIKEALLAPRSIANPTLYEKVVEEAVDSGPFGPATEHEPGATSRRRRRGGDIG